VVNPTREPRSIEAYQSMSKSELILRIKMLEKQNVKPPGSPRWSRAKSPANKVVLGGQRIRFSQE